MLTYKLEIPYGPGDWVWIMDHNVPWKVKIRGIHIHEAELEANDDGEVYRKCGGFSYLLFGSSPSSVYPDDVYPTKKDLVKSLMSKGSAE